MFISMSLNGTILRFLVTGSQTLSIVIFSFIYFELSYDSFMAIFLDDFESYPDLLDARLR